MTNIDTLLKKKRMVKNNHSLSEKGRSEGFVRKTGYEDFDGEFYSLWITTNKTITDGYEIPYLSDEFYQVIKYDFLEKYDPTPIKINKGELQIISLVQKYPMFYPLFRDLKSNNPKAPIAKKKIDALWGQGGLFKGEKYGIRGSSGEDDKSPL